MWLQFQLAPLQLGRLTALEKLTLLGSQLKSVPKELGELTALKILNLRRAAQVEPQTPMLKAPVTSKRLKIESDTLPSKLCFPFQLAPLHLEANDLESLPAELGALTALTTLAIGENQLTSVPAELGRLTALKLLIINKNPQLTSVPAEWEEGGALEQSGCDIRR